MRAYVGFGPKQHCKKRRMCQTHAAAAAAAEAAAAVPAACGLALGLRCTSEGPVWFVVRRVG